MGNMDEQSKRTGKGGESDFVQVYVCVVVTLFVMLECVGWICFLAQATADGRGLYFTPTVRNIVSLLYFLQIPHELTSTGRSATDHCPLHIPLCRLTPACSTRPTLQSQLYTFQQPKHMRGTNSTHITDSMSGTIVKNDPQYKLLHYLQEQL